MTNITMRAAVLTAALGVLGCACPEPQEGPAAPPAELKLETLTKAPVEFADAAEVVMSRVAIPAGKTLPLHYHPGQEFIYLTAGSGTLHLRDADDVPLQAGDHFMVPYKAVHTFTAGDAGAAGIVVRVHEKGEPERVPVDAGGAK